MSWTQLQADQVLSEGADLWIVADLEESAWARKLNWYLNLQLRRAKFHQTRELPAELVAVLQASEIQAPVIKTTSTAPLMIESSSLLPNRLTVQVLEKDSKSWLQAAVRVWNDLQQPSVRVFLPANCDRADLESAWQVPSASEASFIQD